MKKWTIEKSEIVLDNKWMKVRRDTCLLPTGQCIDDYYLWLGNDFSMVFGLTEDSQVILVRQYKHGAGDIVLELPAGVIDKDDDTPLAAAARELREETGYEAKHYISLGELFVSSAKATTKAHCYLATGLNQITDPEPDDQEEIETQLVAISELLHMIGGGKVQDVNSIAVTFLALRKLGKFGSDYR